MNFQMQVGWLTDITNWFRDAFLALWNAFVLFLHDLIVALIAGVMDAFASLVELIPVPDFMTTYSMNSLLGQAGNTIAWLVGTFRVGECLTIIAAGFAFRLLRKLFTLGQW